MKHAKYRGRPINSARDKRLKYEAALALGATDKKGKKTLARLKKNDETFTPFPPLVPMGGIFKGETLGLRVTQGDKAMDLQPKDCTLPHTVAMVWSNAGEENVIYSYTSGKGKAKKSNGCDKVNRKRLHNENAMAKEMDRCFAELDREDEEERIAAERLEDDRRNAKNDWIRVQVLQFERNWLRTKGTTYSQSVSLGDRLNDCLKTEFDYAYANFTKEARSTYRNRLCKEVNAFETIEAYLAKQAEYAADLVKYGKVIDTDKIFSRFTLLSKEEVETEETRTALDDGIARAKKRMLDARTAYDAKRQKKCS
jgi:hypothetical protein